MFSPNFDTELSNIDPNVSNVVFLHFLDVYYHFYQQVKANIYIVHIRSQTRDKI